MAPTLINSGLTQSASGTSPAVVMPASIVAGRLLIGCFYTGNTTIAISGGFTTLFNLTSTVRYAAFAKIAAGSDTSTATLGATNVLAGVMLQYSNWSGTIADIQFAQSGTLIDPPSLDALTTQDWTWLAVAFSASAGMTAAPTNYSNFVKATAGGTSSVSVADRALTAQVEDPGAFTGAGTFPKAATFALPPVPPPPYVPSLVIPSRARLIRASHF